MGCGASSTAVAPAKPAQGAAIVDVVQGKPVFETEALRKAAIVKDLAKASLANLATNPALAAGLAMFAIDVATTIPELSEVNPETDPILAAGIANRALEAAKADSETAAALTESAVTSALAIADSRSAIAGGEVAKIGGGEIAKTVDDRVATIVGGEIAVAG